MQNFELTILGCSSATPTSKRNPTAQLLNIAERFFLIDCGEATQIQFRKFRIRFGRVHQIFISHLHSDHILGLFGYLATQALIGRKKEIEIFGPPDLERFVRNHFALFPESLTLPVVFYSLNQSGVFKIFEDKAVEVFSFPVKHRVPTWDSCSGRNSMEEIISTGNPGRMHFVPIPSLIPLWLRFLPDVTCYTMRLPMGIKNLAVQFQRPTQRQNRPQKWRNWPEWGNWSSGTSQPDIRILPAFWRRPGRSLKIPLKQSMV